jgi:23S rRNA (adenine2503-C2)-methyltransferase
MIALSGLCPEQIRDALPFLPVFRTKQIFKWIARGVVSFDEMTDLSLDLRKDLNNQCRIYSSAISQKLEDNDGTIKLQLTLQDGANIEAVLLVDGEGRRTACLSTQAGCPAACAFCKTGTLGLLRNLNASEIVEQFLYLKSLHNDISNIVVMGMGEPLLNLEELRQAIAVICHPEGLGLSRRRITVSTSGIIDGIREMADSGAEVRGELGVRLAVSITTADEELRTKLMPVTKHNPLPLLKDALIHYQQQQDRRITLEAVLLGGINTRQQDIDALVLFAKGLDCIINLIPWNPVDGLFFEGKPLKEPKNLEIDNFLRQLERRGLNVTRRYRKGKNISGACGQLGSVGSNENTITQRN